MDIKELIELKKSLDKEKNSTKYVMMGISNYREKRNQNTNQQIISLDKTSLVVAEIEKIIVEVTRELSNRVLNFNKFMLNLDLSYFVNVDFYDKKDNYSSQIDDLQKQLDGLNEQEKEEMSKKVVMHSYSAGKRIITDKMKKVSIEQDNLENDISKYCLYNYAAISLHRSAEVNYNDFYIANITRYIDEDLMTKNRVINIQNFIGVLKGLGYDINFKNIHSKMSQIPKNVKDITIEICVDFTKELTNESKKQKKRV